MIFRPIYWKPHGGKKSTAADQYQLNQYHATSPLDSYQQYATAPADKKTHLEDLKEGIMVVMPDGSKSSLTWLLQTVNVDLAHLG